MWIGVVSDTRGELHPEVTTILDGMDFIIHCGGIGSPTVIEELSHLSPVSGVLGTGDTPNQYPFDKVLTRDVGGVRVVVTHRIGTPSQPTRAARKLISESHPDVLLFGYAPEAFNQRIGRCHWMSPGSASGRRGPASVGILEIEGQSIRGEIVLLDGDA